MKNQIAITAIGALSPFGIGFEALKKGLRNREPRFAPIAHFPEEDRFVGAEIPDFNPKEILGRKGLRTLDRNTLLTLSAIQAGLAEHLEKLNKTEVGLTLGTVFGSFTSLADYTLTYLNKGFEALNPMLFPNLVINSPASQGNIRFKLSHSSTTVSNGFTCGLDAIVFSADRIALGREQFSVAGGSEELSYELTVGYHLNNWLSPSKVVRPFDTRADGTLMGEGAALFLLESPESAKNRGAEIIATVEAYNTAFHQTLPPSDMPDPNVGAEIISETLRECQLSPSDLAFVATSANGIGHFDQLEARSLEIAFKKELSTVPVVAYKAYWGETLAAAGALQMAAAIADLQDGLLSGTPTSSQPKYDLNIPVQPVKVESPYALLFSAGPAGHFTAMVLKVNR